MTIVLFLGANISNNSSTTEKAVLNLFFPISIRFFKSEPRRVIEIFTIAIYKVNQYSNSVKNSNINGNILVKW